MRKINIYKWTIVKRKGLEEALFW